MAPGYDEGRYPRSMVTVERLAAPFRRPTTVDDLLRGVIGAYEARRPGAPDEGRAVIAFLRGPLLEAAADLAVIDAAGVGYQVIVSASTAVALPAVGSTTQLHIHAHFVKDEPLRLYGFADLDDRADTGRGSQEDALEEREEPKRRGMVRMESRFARRRRGDRGLFCRQGYDESE